MAQDVIHRIFQKFSERLEAIDGEWLLSYQDLPYAPSRMHPGPISQLPSQLVDAARFVDAHLDKHDAEARSKPDLGRWGFLPTMVRYSYVLGH
jgi:hypothetical protein